jgi:quercetin 2,3-dioxygenase
MLSQAEARIFLAVDRGYTETAAFRSYHAFYFGSYQHEDKAPFPALHALNDETLAGGKSAHFSVEEDTLVLALPVVGAVVTSSNETGSQFVHAGQALFLKSGRVFAVKSPFDEDMVNYLQILDKASSGRRTHVRRGYVRH